MTWENREGSCNLFYRKHQGNQPALGGELLLNGITYEIAGWVKKTSTGKDFYSLKFSVKEEEGAAAPRSAPKAGGDEMDDIPF